ncbi:nidogen-2 isoform X2 [Periophthalmus magnuspinnatus]|uniref:nidogen-2 isoform X2 n=1 Tax=Periophthalmus magnuspinnatus TaxID=409849 RepID=UPI002436CE0B|nr:nidogen-2 isoform X2 [Periophthalmus magnuspinnatus]
MDRGQALAVWLLCCWGSVRVVTGLHRSDLFPYGSLSGDLILAEGDDETSKVLTLPRPLRFYDAAFAQLYVATNGIISAQDLPMEKQYVDDGFPTDFPVVAPFLADIDTSDGQGQIYYRVTETPSVLNRVAREVTQGFPDARFTPTHAVVATWENVAAYEVDPKKRPTNKVNTFQAVIGYDETDSYVVFLYPEDGLNFFGTRPKESYNVEIELPARVGFSRGEVSYLLFSRTEGPYYSVRSVRNLHQVGNTGIPGVWLFHTGNRYSFDNIVPASFGGLLATAPPRGYEFGLDSTTPEYAELEEYSDNIYSPDEDEEEDYPLTGGDAEFQPVERAATPAPQTEAPPTPRSTEDAPLTEPSERPGVEPRRYAPPPPPQDTANAAGRVETAPQQPQVPLEVVDVYPPPPSDPHLSPGGHVVNVDEDDVDFDTGVIQYTTENKETCARFQQQCSQNALCSDYATGFCCHCKPGFYGNGRQCLPDGAPQRVSGKVSGTVTVGSSPVRLDHIDLHAYIVVGDGRAYTAISEVPESIGRALMPVSPIGELFGWLFVLELPNSQAGFKVTGAEFTRHAEVVFYPSNERLSIVQTGRGLDEQNHITVDTVVNGNVPSIPPGAEVTMDPFKEVYQFYPSVTTSTSVREFTVVSADRGSESFSFQLKQNITYRDCRHDSRRSPETLQISMERVFMMYVTEERILRYAITNKISPVGVEPSGPDQVNPCYSGTHDCDTTAQCVPQEGVAFECKCATGYSGDGRNCYDVDECAESASSCGAHAQCVNLPGSHRCQCQAGYEFGFDGRTCVDVDECSSSPCSADARCMNGLGTFHCQCHSGFYGDGFSCSQEGQTGRPKSHCEQHRDNLQTGLDHGVGAFVPQCEADGRYRPLQCHGSTGHCWCVDNSGQEKPGTRTPPGTPPTDCNKPDEPARHKTQCEHHRDSVQTTNTEGYPILGAYVPQCDADGQYTPQQCHGSTGHCWCVDSAGQERPGTRTPPGTSPHNCTHPEGPVRPKTQCEHHRDSVQTASPEGYPILGAFVPECDANGRYTPQQCDGSTGYCWCVDSTGQERPGTRTPPGSPSADCDRPVVPERPKTHCEHHRDSVQTTSPEGYPILGVYAPQCDANGEYLPQQCHGSTGHCWCVDSTGQERPGTRTSPGSASHNCSQPDEPERPKTRCEHHRDSIQTTSPEGYPIVGLYVPQCDADGQYSAQQCHGSIGHCWCVDSVGQERSGTRTGPGTPSVDCSKPDQPQRPKTHCEHHRDSVQTTSPEGYPILGAYVPQCDANGQYNPLQCHGSTGHCWCVDSTGQERADTRTPPGSPPVDCDRPVEPTRPKTRCEHHRDSVQTSTPEGQPLVGAYVPQCDENGQYSSRQCHGSTGHCWCVDSTGQERPGTRSSPGTPRVDCDRPVEPTRPKTQCEHHRDSVQTSTPEGQPLVGAYVPQCDENGQYSSRQCHGSTGHCWCVDSTGQERPGTRSSPGTPRVDCDRPVEPTRPKTQCEHHRDSVQTSTPEGQPLVGAYVPQCDENGQYSSRQCHGSTGHCWCVDSTGQERPGTRSSPGTPRVDCNKPDQPQRPKTYCEHHRDSVQTTSPEGYPILGAYVPQCDAEGQYLPQQCHGSTGHCWCVDTTGQERAGSRTEPGVPPKDCSKPDEPVRPKTHCEHHRDSVQSNADGRPLIGAYVPQCDATGQYVPKQCHGSSGHCWCVDVNGRERAGTRTPPGSPPLDCNRPAPVAPTQRPESVCERWRASLIQHYGGKPEPQQYLPQCEPDGHFSPVQCYGETTYCWCVDQDGREVPGTRSHDVVKPACLPSVAPPTVRPVPRPNVTPPPNADVTLLYAQGQKIGALPLDGTKLDANRSKTLLTLHGSIVVGIAFDCKENQVYWTDLSARTISRASMLPGAEPEILISSNLVSPEGLAVDSRRRKMFWVDSSPDLIETSNLDGTGRTTLFDTNLVNPRAIIVVPSSGTLFWTDWNREAPKIETASVDGQKRRVVVSDGIGLPNALTFDSSSGQVCWADAGTKRLECIYPDGSGRKVIHPNLNYPFSMVYYREMFYYTDWRRDGVIAVNKETNKLTDEYLPEQRSHLYGIAIASSQCLPGVH